MTFLLQVKVICITILASVMLFLRDNLPEFIRRRMLPKADFSGTTLEERLKIRVFAGWATVKAIYHMRSINIRPRLAVGEHVGDLKVLRLSSQEEVSVAKMCTSASRPLVLNFGSCT